MTAERPKPGTAEYRAMCTPGIPEHQQMITRVVDPAPPFSEEKRRRLRLLLRPIDAKYRGQKPAA